MSTYYNQGPVRAVYTDNDGIYKILVYCHKFKNGNIILPKVKRKQKIFSAGYFERMTNGIWAELSRMSKRKERELIKYGVPIVP